MSFNYNPLWKLLIDKEMSKTELKNKIHINSTTLAKLGKNKNVSMAVLDRVCTELNCDINEIVEHIKIIK